MRYMQKYIIADAWQMVAAPVDLPQWLIRWEFVRVFSDTDDAFSHGILSNQEDKNIPPTRVNVGDWVVLDNNGLRKMTDAEFKGKFEEISNWQGDLFDRAAESDDADEGVVPDHAEPLDDDDRVWFDFDSSKPASTMSVRDHVFIELLKARVSAPSAAGMKILLETHDDMVDFTLTAMGYD